MSNKIENRLYDVFHDWIFNVPVQIQPIVSTEGKQFLGFYVGVDGGLSSNSLKHKEITLNLRVNINIRVTDKCVSKLTIIGSDNGLAPGRLGAIIWTNAVILLIGHLRTKLSEIANEIQTFSFKTRMWNMISSPATPTVCQIFKVATWHYRCRHHLKNNCIRDNLQCCLLFGG